MNVSKILECARMVVQVVGSLRECDRVTREPLGFARPSLFRQRHSPYSPPHHLCRQVVIGREARGAAGTAVGLVGPALGEYCHAE